ncbi:MAG TPA: hypothetical protein VKA21_00540, partial [Candidatus Binatia bacterium]|nr:hypothetical protein [Candidatus Binatia bacterium]
VLEDLHWSDPSTLDVLSYVARRPEPCRLMLLATYRPTDVILRRHPVRGLERELRAHRQSVQLSLGRLSPASVADWLAALCASPPPALVQWLHRRTEGHPLFVGALLEALVAAGSVDCGGGEWTLAPGYAEFGVPESVSLMIDREAESLDPTDREVLDAASAAGTPFSAASVAAAVERDVVAVEARCDALARDGRFVRAAGSSEWPDGTVASAYDFIHELHRSRLYERLSPSHARLLHQRVGRRLEQAYGARVDEIATELSVHFERGRDAPRALRHLDTVATHCAARGAHREAIATLRRALAVTDLLPGSTERVDRRLYLGLRLGASLLVAEDYADPEVERTFRTCRDLAERADALPPLLTALAGLHAYHSARARLDDAAAIVPRMLELAARLPLAEATLVAHTCAAWSAWSCGELAVAREHARQAIAVKPSVPMPFPSTFDLVGWAFGTQAFAELALGDVPGARALSEEGVAWSERTARPVDRATALALAGMLSACEGDRPSAAARAHAAVAVAEEHGYRQWRAIGRIVAAWADAADPAPHVDEYVRLGFRAELSTFLCLAAEVRLRAGATEAALALVDRAEEHVRETGERWYEAEVHRLRGEAWIADDARRAEAALQRALDVARAQGAKLWELRARRLLDGLG